jgi:hypothetical protein
MRSLAALVSALAVLAVAAPAQAEPTWANPVKIFASTGLTPGSTVSCFGNPAVAGMLVSASAATYGWTLDDVGITGATASEYVVRNADLGHSLRCQMSLETAEGPLSGSSEPVVLPVVDDGPPRLMHNGASLECCALTPLITKLNVPAVVRDTGPVLDAVFCSPGTWSGINGPTGSHWTFEFLRNGTVEATVTRDGDPRVPWRGYPAGWVDDSRGGWPQYVEFYAWHRRPADVPGQSLQCRVTVTNGAGQATSTSQPLRPLPDTPTEPAPAKITAKAASGVLRRGSFTVTYAGKGKLKAKAGKHVVASGTAKSGVAKLKLTAAGRKLLKRKHRLTVTVTARGTSTRITLRA